MTGAEIDAMPAGPEMDALVQKQLFEACPTVAIQDWGAICQCGQIYSDGTLDYRPAMRHADLNNRPYIRSWSTSDAAALEVLARMPGSVQIVRCLAGTWTCWIRGTDETDDCPTLALAICRAALKAVMK